MKNWSATKKIVVALIIIAIIVVIWNWNKIFGNGNSSISERSNPLASRFKARASELNARLKELIDQTNSRLRKSGDDGGIYHNEAKIPSGLCKCWQILWGFYGYYSKRCCDTQRIAPNQNIEAILSDFRSKAAVIEADGNQLNADIEAAFPGSVSKEKGGCCCAWLVYAGIGFCIGRRKVACCEATSEKSE